MTLLDLQRDDPGDIGPYTLRGRLGAGGMGVVYLGFGPDGSAAAVKTLRPSPSSEDRERLRHEAELLARVVHPHIARYRDANPDADLPWLAPDYIPGPALAELTAPLAKDQLANVASGLADGLGALHEVGVVHRDLKPSNVILTHAGPVIVDLGIARTHDMTALTQTGMVVGSPMWMAPEQFRGVDVGSAADVWGWGMTVTFAGTLRSPFGDGPLEALAWRIQHDAPDLDGLPSDLVDAVTAALAKQPSERPSARELSGSLLASGEGETLRIPPGEAVNRTSSYTLHMPDAGGRTTRAKRRFPKVPTGSLIALIWVCIAVLGLVLTRQLSGMDDSVTSNSNASAPPSTSQSVSSLPSSESASSSETASVIPDQVQADLQMFTSALDDNFKSLVFDLQDVADGTSKGAEFDAPILGSWWSLSDWCVTNRRGTAGSCYDAATSYYRHWFDRDPREINTETWQGAGAIGSLVVAGYETTEQALGREGNAGRIPDLVAGRPGVDVLCTPSCVQRIDSK